MIKVVFKGFVGAILGVLSLIALSPALAAFSHNDGTTSVALNLSIIGLGAVMCAYARNIRHALGRGFLYLGCSIFVLPISAFLLSGRVVLDVADTSQGHSDGVALAAAGVAGAAVTGVATLLGFFLGSVFLILGIVLVLGGRREVIVVKENDQFQRS